MARLPVHQKPKKERQAMAPYNFVPLPEKVVTVDLNTLPDQDRYHPDRHTGWIQCQLTAASPLFVRAALEQDEFERSLKTEVEAKRPWGEQVRNKADFFYVDPETRTPVIPGSSLRGMLRALVEIAGYGKVQWVTDQQRYFFRAVAAARSDPLRDPYRDIIGAFARNVGAGYLFQRGDAWYVQPSMSPQAKGWPERSSFLKVKERQVIGNVPGYIELESRNYHPQVHAVSFDVQVRQSERGSYAWISRIGPESAGYSQKGTLVCSGNMLETAKPGQRTPRRNHALVLLANERAEPLKIRPEAVQDYLAGLTPFQRDELGDWNGGGVGCLGKDAPVFYVTEGKEVTCFGHCPNFRVPFRRPGKQRASSPLDYVPERLRRDEDVDLAEAIFGYTKPVGEGKARAYAGRVFVTDAVLQVDAGQSWLAEAPLVPRILASPKPTTFQHYLVQTRPSQTADLAHYGTGTPDDTAVRGHKLYWHKGPVAAQDVAEADTDEKHDTQHTQIQPVKEGTAFNFRIYYENLLLAELGALLWVLDKAQDDAYRLKLGMAKPHGMGAVRIDWSLHLTGRAQRYQQLFQDGGWAQAVEPAGDLEKEAMAAFERLILEDRDLNPDRATSLDCLDRIQALLAMLSWPGPDPDLTRYLQVEHPENGNEYRDRPILPDPLAILAGRAVEPPAPPPMAQPVRQPAREEIAPLPKEPARPTVGKSPKPRPKPGYQLGTVMYFNLDEGRGTISLDSTGQEVEIGLDQLHPGTGYLAKGRRVSFRVTEEGGRIRLADVGPL